MKKQDLPIFVSNHHDLTWRRCFDRDLVHKGEHFVSYAHLEALFILDNLKMAKEHPEYKFTIECVAVLEKFLEKYPEYRAEIADLLKEGRIQIPFSGHNIVDSNLIEGESIIRNYLYGYEYLKNEFDYHADGMERNDAFGNSAQLPQIARGFGVNWVYNIAYNPLKGPYWKGLDGSVVAEVPNTIVGASGGFYKYRPCPACKGDPGVKCEVCKGERIDRAEMEARRAPLKISQKRTASEELKGTVMLSGEEVMPFPGIFDWIKEHEGEYHIYFSHFKELAHRYYQDLIDGAEAPEEDRLHPSAEANCNNTGCYVTRIKTKQRVRKAESRIYGLEALAVMNSRKGNSYPKKALCALWNQILFTMFHDAVTGTMVDAAFEELMEIHDQIEENLLKQEVEQLSLCVKEKEGCFTVINPYGRKASGEISLLCKKNVVLADEKGNRAPIIECIERGEDCYLRIAIEGIDPFSSRTLYPVTDEKAFEKEILRFERNASTNTVLVLQNDDASATVEKESGIYTIENDFFRITADFNGITEIFDKSLASVVAKEGQYKVGEWILEHDEGSPWTTLSEDRRRRGLACRTQILSIERTADCQRITFQVRPDFWAYSLNGYQGTYSVALIKGRKRVDFSADIGWDCQNHRITIAFPAAESGKSIYEIPYGQLERKPYAPTIIDEQGKSNWAAANGDYPAIHWAGIEGETVSLALMNKGTPCYHIEDGCIEMTVLRSPTLATYLHEPNSYTMTDFYGMRDVGKHHFEYALCAYEGAFAKSSVAEDGAAYQATLYGVSGIADLPEMPALSAESVSISACKQAEDGEGFIYRLVEYGGKEAVATLQLPHDLMAEEDDLKEERIQALPQDGKITFRPFEIKTIRFKPV